MRRFLISEHSMLPSLRPGDELVATDGRVAPGDVVVFEHPHRPDFWMVKRVERVKGEVAWVSSDNQQATRADSRTLGWLPVATLLRRVETLDEHTFSDAVDLLAAEDERLAAVIEAHGKPAFWNRPPGLGTLVLLILEQQVSLASGMAAYRRLVDAIGPVTPGGLLGLGDKEMREIGFSRQKAAYVRALASAVDAGEVGLEVLDTMDDDTARMTLTSLRGVGAWTADAYLLSALRRPDVWPVGDRALQVGAGEALGIPALTTTELEDVAEPWRPLRAVAARLIWHSYLARRGRSEPVLPASHEATEEA